MNDNVSYKMAADYKSYELRQVIQDLKDMASTPNGRKAVKPYWEDIYKSHSELVNLLNDLPPWEEEDG